MINFREIPTDEDITEDIESDISAQHRKSPENCPRNRNINQDDNNETDKDVMDIDLVLNPQPTSNSYDEYDNQQKVAENVK